MNKRLILAVLSLFMLSSCGGKNEEPISSNKPIIEYELESYDEEDFTRTKDTKYEEISDDIPSNDFHTPRQFAYLNSPYISANNYATGLYDYSQPRELRFDFSSDKLKGDRFYVQVSEDGKFNHYDLYVTSVPYIDVINLKLDTLYYYRASTSLSFKKSKMHAFATNDLGYRNLWVDGLTNVRDFGGKESKYGYTLKQGLIYRGGRLNRTTSPEVVLEFNDRGYHTLKDEMGVNTEIDFRSPTDNEIGSMSDSVIPDITYINPAIDASVSNRLVNCKEQIKQTFKTFANPDNYPIYFHCDIGTDRTGLTAFLLGNLLGMSADDLYRDYMLSNFARIGEPRTTSHIDNTLINDFGKKIDAYEGNNRSEKVADYLIKECGLTQEEIDEILRIMLDPNYEILSTTQKSNVAIEGMQNRVIKEGSKVQLFAKVNDFKATNATPKWSSSDGNVVKVNSSGLLEAIEFGVCDVTCKIDGVGEQTIRVTVYQSGDTIINNDGDYLIEAEQFDLSNTVFLKNQDAYVENDTCSGDYSINLVDAIKGVSRKNWGSMEYEFETDGECDISFSMSVQMPGLVAASNMQNRFVVSVDGNTFGNLSSISAQSSNSDWKMSNGAKSLHVEEGTHLLKIAYVGVDIGNTDTGCPYIDFVNLRVANYAG